MDKLINVCRFPYDNKNHLQEDFGMFQDYNGNGPYDRLFSRIKKQLIDEVNGKYLLSLSTPHFHNNFVSNFEVLIESDLKLKNDIVNKNVKFLIFRIGEFDGYRLGNFLDDEPYLDFIRLIKKYGRDDSDCLYLSFNYNVNYALRNSGLKKRYHNFCQLNLYNIIKNNKDVLLKSFHKSNQLRPYHYLCYNFNRKPHREKVVKFLMNKKHGLLSSPYHNLFLDGKKSVDGWTSKNRNLYYYANRTHYNNTYFSIITESHFSNIDDIDNLSFTEKTWKPITNFHPFFMVGGYQSLSKLKELGFETFHQYFDESYEELGLDYMLKAVNDVLKKDIKQIHDIYYGMNEVLVHNFNNYFKICEEEIEDLQNYLFDFCYKE